jgi:putative spermidine/putrescine transport system ATP-binding protein
MTKAASLSLSAVSFGYGSTMTLKSVDLQIEPGELVTLVGPSGCGKSTLLRLVTGLLAPNSGRILIDGVDMGNTAPEKRRIGWMPQSYALFEHLDVASNVAFGLKMQGVQQQKRAERVNEVLELCRIADLADRAATALSGGQRQRVAVARALAVGPRVLLLDEPLAALDPQLRLEVRSGLERLLRKTGVTTVFVTHDQDEALALADRVAVLKDGELQQFDTPENLWHKPANEFVAKFLGNATVLAGRRIGEEEVELLPDLRARVPGTAAPVVALRPMDLEVSQQGALVTVTAVEYAGGRYQVSGRHESGSTLRFYAESRPSLGQLMYVTLRVDSELALVGRNE